MMALPLSVPVFDWFIPIEKNHHLLKDGSNDHTIKILKWFTNGFYNVMKRPDGKIQFNDLRFGTFRQEGHIDDYVFRFHLEKEMEGKYNMVSTLGGPDPENANTLLKDLLKRIAGR